MTLHLFAANERPRFALQALPGDYLSATTDWLRSAHKPTERLHALIGVVSIAAKVSELDEVAAAAFASGCGELLVGTPKRLVRFVETSSAVIMLSVAGPTLDDQGLIEEASELVELARRLAPQTGYAFLSLGEHITPLCSTPADHHRAEERVPLGVVRWLSNQAIYDASWFQIISRSHYEALAPDARGLCEALGGDRYAMTIGSPEEWLIGASRLPEVLTHGRTILDPLLLTPEEIHARVRAT